MVLPPRRAHSRPSHTGSSLDSASLLYIGESANLRARLVTHCRVAWCADRACYAYVTGWEKRYERHEIENDLVGAHYTQIGGAPAWQFARVPSVN
jgi:hypothetical protein